MYLADSRKRVTLICEYTGLHHLLYSGRGAGGTSHDGEAEELHVACFMGLVSFLTSRLEVLRVAPRHRLDLLDAAARATIQTATTTDTPLTDAGLDGTGQVIQVGFARFFREPKRHASPFLRFRSEIFTP